MLFVNRMSDLKKYLSRQLYRVFAENPWYGEGVLEKLDKLDPALVELPRAGQIHTLSQQVQHMIAWRKYVLERLKGNDSYVIEADSELDWASSTNVPQWTELLSRLHATQAELTTYLEGCSDTALVEQVPGMKRSRAELIQGIIHHDVYHLGQIGIINKLEVLDG